MRVSPYQVSHDEKTCNEEMQIKLETYNDCNCNFKSVIANKHNSAHIRVQ